MANRLLNATSPYLLQHADNPVDWWEWSPEAFAEAAARDVPVLLSVGYASCHWCHVMAHESFEDPATTTIMNSRFVNVKVDREERPDIDRIYMDAVQAMTGQGGWPMTVFLTPAGAPFFAGTYFPKTDRHGHPAFTRVLESIHDAWTNHRAEVEAQAGSLVATISVPTPIGDSVPGPAALRNAYKSIRLAYDPTHGGFGRAPKFPQASTLEFLLRSIGKEWAPEAETMLIHTLDAMANGGIHDQVGGGFSRYSVDDRWLVPHFEKMLYDNALLARLYARASQVTGLQRFADIARSTLDYMLRDLGLPGGGFASGEDADSEGEEGRFYIFSWSEFSSVTDSTAVAEVLGVTPNGNFEGRSILHRDRPVDEVAAAHGLSEDRLEADVRSALKDLAMIRADRVRPGLDDKAVCAWNGLAIRALAEAGVALEIPRYIDAARDAARFVLTEMRGGDGRVFRSWRDGRTSNPAFCDDYGALAVGLFSLYQATSEPEWFDAARVITSEMIELFADEEAGGFHATGNDVEQLIARPKNLFDSPTPSDNALAAEALQHLAAFSGDPALLERLDRVFQSASLLIDQSPIGAGHMLSVLLVSLEPAVEVAIVGRGPARQALETVIRHTYRPHVFVAVGDGSEDHGIPLLSDRPAGGEAAAYVCHGFVCRAPVESPEALSTALR
jgi:uncharacterized protein YyaL (SSP411 family)